MTAGYRLLMKSARLAHLVLSMFGLLALLFFGLTGLILNHPDWFNQDEPEVHTETGTLPPRLLKRPLDKLLVVEHLRSEYGITAPVAKEEKDKDGNDKDGYDDDDPELLRVSFKAPGRDVVVAIVRYKDDDGPRDPDPTGKKEGDLTVTYQTHNLAGRLTDLHRGKACRRDPGEVWSLVIDGASVLLVCLGLTGLILWLSLKTRRWLGLGALSLGAGVLLGIYFWLVP